MMPVRGWVAAVIVYLIGAVLSYGLFKGSEYKHNRHLARYGLWEGSEHNKSLFYSELNRDWIWVDELLAWIAGVCSWYGVFLTFIVNRKCLGFCFRIPKN
jgi:hypothetical protein